MNLYTFLIEFFLKIGLTEEQRDELLDDVINTLEVCIAEVLVQDLDEESLSKVKEITRNQKAASSETLETVFNLNTEKVQHVKDRIEEIVFVVVRDGLSVLDDKKRIETTEWVNKKWEKVKR